MNLSACSTNGRPTREMTLPEVQWGEIAAFNRMMRPLRAGRDDVIAIRMSASLWEGIKRVFPATKSGTEPPLYGLPVRVCLPDDHVPGWEFEFRRRPPADRVFLWV